ncbi:hypothetical protein SAY86_012304 [Trapa natans]|uniref:Uncharacterized protein n=1 Tax=Trapa natans TaxID=22666 RepID=A0AAN7LWX5_TRANT|nr:hypothetical protein SAY86_012304 [Trapa natans]
MRESVDLANFPLADEKVKEMTERVDELRKVFESLKKGLDPWSAKLGWFSILLYSTELRLVAYNM